jgi:tetratricopeptide (TPR) repeat protein
MSDEITEAVLSIKRPESHSKTEEAAMSNSKPALMKFVLALCVAGVAASAQAQSQNLQAMNWFKAASVERDPQLKIEAYTRALEYDSTFAEAYYNLGMLYKQAQDHRRAELHLRRAYVFKSGRFTSDQKDRLLYDLAFALKKQGKTAEAEKMLREAKTQIADKKLRSMAVFELGKLLFEQNRMPEALQELREGQKINPANQTYFSNLIQLTETGIALQSQYDKALQAEAQGQWQDARLLLGQIQNQNASYKDVATRMARLDSILSAETGKAQTLAVTFEQAQQYENKGELELAISVYEHLLQQKGEQLEWRSRLTQAREKLEQKRRGERAESEYAVGLAALKAQNWTGAVLAFERVLEIDGNYPNVRDKIAEAQANLQRESKDNVNARYYAEGLAAMEREDWGDALAAFEKVRRLDPEYREVKSKLAQVERALEVPRQLAADAGNASVTRAQTLYEEALVAMAKEDWMRAVVNLETVQLLQPNYRDVVDRLAQARTQLHAPASAAAESASGDSPMSLALMLTAVVMLPLLGFLVLSPAMRARYYLLRGDHAAVARIYERMLAKNPQRAKLNPTIVTTLSNYYLMSGREDEHAQTVHKFAQDAKLLASPGIEPSAQGQTGNENFNLDALKALENSLSHRKTSSYTSR